MNRKEAAKLLANIDVIKAFANGRDIQHKGYNGWYDHPNPTFGDTPDSYRIKPRPIEGWVNVYEDGSFGGLHGTKALAEARAVGAVARTVFVREGEN